METTLLGCRIYYEISRPENATHAPVLLLLHGWGCDTTFFSFLTKAFSATATIIALDFPGHGQSGYPQEPWELRDYAEMVCALLRELNIPSAHVLGHSHGGRVAAFLASEYPAFVDKLVITGGAGIKKPATEQQRRRTQRYKRFNRVLEWMKKMPFLVKPVEKWQARLRNHYGSPDYVQLNEVMRKTFVKLISQDLSPSLGNIQASTLLIWGSEDTETPLWMGQQMEKSIPDAGLVVFEGRGHFAFLDEGQRFALIVKQFLLEGNG